MWQDEYYKRLNGDCPAEEWLDSQGKEARGRMHSKMAMLRREGLLLIRTNTLEPIKNLRKKDKQDKSLYELKAGQYRICTYFDRNRNTFVYLTGWKKTRNFQTDDVVECRKLLHEYLAKEEERQ